MSSKCSPKDEDNESTTSPLSVNEDHCDQLANDLMTSSYNEISFSESDDQTDVELAEELDQSSSDQKTTKKELTKKLSSSLSLPHLSSTIVKWTERTKASYETENLNLNSSLKFDQNSQIEEIPDYMSCEGNLVSYVTKDFEQKLKHSTSSPSIEGIV